MIHVASKVFTLAPVLALSLCRPVTSPDEPGPRASTSQAASDKPDEPVDVVGPDEPAPRPKTSEPGWAQLGGPSSCELGCAAVHDCVLVEGQRGEAEAAAIELGCLDACVTLDQREEGELFSCRLPEELGLDTCGEFLACVRDAWPSPDSASPTPPPVEFEGRGCDRACLALARCNDVDQSSEDLEAVEECSQLCVRALDPEREREAGECTKLASCPEIEACIMALPGA